MYYLVLALAFMWYVVLFADLRLKYSLLAEGGVSERLRKRVDAVEALSGLTMLALLGVLLANVVMQFATTGNNEAFLFNLLNALLMFTTLQYSGRLLEGLWTATEVHREYADKYTVWERLRLLTVPHVPILVIAGLLPVLLLVQRLLDA